MPLFIEKKLQEKCYNVCTGKKQEIVSIAKEIIRQTESSSRLKIEKDGWNREYTGDNQKMTEEIGCMSFTPMEQAVAEMIDYYKSIDIRLEGNY